ncbi:MAG: arsenate reductase ArsC [Mycobacterium sp.]|uniref:arsenate reductase ArsC n=1 Tax=Mycobacterium sp. TaxID=1785 RepID=UPI003BB5FEA7
MKYDDATESGLHIELSVNDRRALKTAVARLQAEFANSVDAESVQRLIDSSYDKLNANATIRDFLPLLAERFARQRLQALTKINDKSSEHKPVVLFLCSHNAGRSQMAMGFFNHLAGGGAVVWSGGSQPVGEINPAAVAVMAERGIDISGGYPKPWTGEILHAADVIVSMGCGEASPATPGRRYEDWPLDDPAGKDVASIRPIRDEIERRVRLLLDDLRIPRLP